MKGEDKKGKKGEGEGGRVWLPQELKSKLENMRIHRRQPLYEVIQELLDEHNKIDKLS